MRRRVCPSGTVCREVCLCGTPPRGCSVVERHKEGLRLTAAGPSRRMAGCILDPARADIRKVKCDYAWGRSDVFTDESDRAEDRAAFGTGACVCAEGRTALCTAGAFVRRSGRVLYRLAHLCGGSGDFPHRGKHSARKPADFLYRRSHLCGGPTAFCTRGCIRAKPRASFRTGSRHFAERRSTLCTGPRHCARTRAGFRTPVCTGAPAGTDVQTGLCSLRTAPVDSASIHAESHFTL